MVDQMTVRNVPADDLPEVLDLLLEHLGLRLMCERTPDYTNYELAPKVGVMVAQEALPDEWNEAQRICDLPAVDEAITALIDDPTGDNATCVVRAVLRARGVMGTPAPKPEPAGWRWKYGDTDHHKWVVADSPPPMMVKVFRLEPLFAAGVGGLDHQTFPPHSPIDGKDR